MKLIALLFSVTIFLYTGCSLQRQNFSYTNKTYAIDSNYNTKTDMKIHGNFISFNPYLFEFNIRITQYDSIDQHTGKRVFHYVFDTANVYLIDINKKAFFEFDSFTTKAKLLSTGKLQEKKYGTQFPENNSIETDTLFTPDLLKDTALWGEQLLYYSSIQKNTNNIDSVVTYIFFIKKPNFISFHDVPNRLIKNDSYSMVGFSIHLLEKNQKVTNELEELRNLTRSEEEICNRLVNIMQTSNKSKSPG